MAKKKHKNKHAVAKEFPQMGSPMDPANHPVSNIPDPSGGAFEGTGLNPAMMSGQ